MPWLRPLVLLPLVLALACSSNEKTSPGASGSGGAGGSGGSSGSGGGGGSGGSGGSGGGSGGGLPEATGPIRYPHGVRHSPLSKSVINKLKEILAAGSGRSDVFAKVGDSNTVNTGFLNCFAGTDVKLGAHPELDPTQIFFEKTSADGTHSSFDRTTLAAKVGWSSGAPLSGNPCPIEMEITAISPGFAVVMLGTNDTYPQGVEPFASNMLRVVDALASRGVVPLLTTIPPRGDTAEAAALVPQMNAIVRAVAQARQVPMFDLFGALAPLPDFGLISDGIHLQIFAQNGAHACWLDDAGLVAGMNQRNLITLEALDRARRFVLEAEAPEPRPAELEGEGTWEKPFEIDSLPFVDDRDTSKSQTSIADQYACSTANEGGAEFVYRLTLDAPKNLRIRVFDDANADIDVHFMSDPGGAENCTNRADKVLDVSAGPGTYWISADTYVDATGPLPGPYLFTVVEL